MEFFMRVSRVLAVLAFALVFGSTCADAADIRIAYQPSPLYAPLFVAKAKGWVQENLAKANLQAVKIVWSSFAAGPAMNESFAAGQQDIGFMGDAPALIGKAAGIDTRIIGLSLRGPKGLALVAGPNASFSSPNDMKGKKIAVTKGSWGQHLLALILEEDGLTFKDIEVINMPPAEIPPAINSGTVDAGVTWEPYISRSETILRIVRDGTGLKSGVQPIIATQEAVGAKRAAIEAVLDAYRRGAAFIRENPRAAAELASKESGLPPDLLQKVFAKQDFAPALTPDDIKEFKKTEAYMRQLKLIARSVDVDAWIDASFAPQRNSK
jgi:sulfonate transport system substrate-binding protein